MSEETLTPSTLSLVPAAPLFVAIFAGEGFLRNLMAFVTIFLEVPKTFCEAVPLSNDFCADAVVVAGGKTSRKMISVLSIADTVSSGDGVYYWR